MKENKNYQILSLAQKAELLEQVHALIEESLDYAPENKFNVDFAPLHANNLENCWVMLDQSAQAVVAHIGLVKKIISLGKKSFPAFFIGGVAVSSAHRGKGLFSILMKHVLETYAQDCALFFLWSEKHQLYAKFSFFSGIGQAESIPENNFDDFINDFSFKVTKYAALSAPEKDQIKRLYREQVLKSAAAVLRTEADWKNIEKISSADLFINKNSKGEIIFYFFANKGQDLKGIIHEYAHAQGQEDLAMKLFTAARTWMPENEKLRPKDYHLQMMALVRLGSPQLFIEFIHNWSAGKIEVLQVTEDKIHCKIYGELIESSLEIFFRLIFGPYPDQRWQDLGPALFIHGLDSV